MTVWVNKYLLRLCGPKVTPSEIAAKVEKQFGAEAELGCYVDNSGRFVVFDKSFPELDKEDEDAEKVEE